MGETLEHLKLIKAIDEQYGIAEEESSGFRYGFGKAIQVLDEMLDQVPQEYWIQ